LGAIRNAVKRINIDNDLVVVSYEYRSDLVEQIKERGREILIPAEERDRLLAYNAGLSYLTKTLEGDTVSLQRFLQPLFGFAVEKSAKSGQPEVENQSLILVLTLYAMDKPLEKLIGEQGDAIPVPVKKEITLLGRADLAKHFLISAAITGAADTSLANAIGLYKEIEDSRGGSGFSFADLAADRAGVRFAELATKDRQQAAALQQRASNIFKESDFMPAIDRLPEGLQELDFAQAYTDTESESYNELRAEIERRISVCSIYK
jgi:hypothetical protein